MIWTYFGGLLPQHSADRLSAKSLAPEKALGLVISLQQDAHGAHYVTRLRCDGLPLVRRPTPRIPRTGMATTGDRLGTRTGLAYGPNSNRSRIWKAVAVMLKLRCIKWKSHATVDDLWDADDWIYSMGFEPSTHVKVFEGDTWVTWVRHV